MTKLKKFRIYSIDRYELGAFICQISEDDWLVSRRVGAYGNREGTERNGKPLYFRDMKERNQGAQIVQSIIEDLIGMTKGDTLFFHVIDAEERESSVHGIYIVREEPFYNDIDKFWDSNPYFVYPYRFCFEPHPRHAELCKYDASVLVSEFYRSIENREIRSILTLEREVRGAAHAIKTVTSEDAKEIEKLLYRDFSSRHQKEPIVFQPLHMQMFPLRNYVQDVGKIEFAVKALVAYHLGRRTRDLIQFIPACQKGEYDFLIESFVGQTTRKPVDILCISRNEERTVSILEAKTDLTKMDDLVQSLRYLELFKLRNIDRGALTYRMSVCLLAKRFQQNLVHYVSVRNAVMPWEEITLLKYEPSHDGKDADFTSETLTYPELLASPETYPAIDVDDFTSRIESEANSVFATTLKKTSPKTTIEFLSSEDDTIVLRKHYDQNGKKIFLADVCVRVLREKCTLNGLSEFLNRIRIEASKLKGDFIAVEPILIAQGYDQLVDFFLREFNVHEKGARRQPISAYLSSMG